MNHLIVRSAMKRGFAGGNFRRYFAVAPGITPKFGVSAAKVSDVEVEKLGGLLIGWRRMMSSAAEPAASSPPSVEKATSSESTKEEGEKGDLVVSSYWGVSRPKIKRADGTDWPWNCFMPWETYAADLSIDLHKHHVPKAFLDKVAYRTVKLIRTR